MQTTTFKHTTTLRNHLLVAMPRLRDPIFHRSLTYLCDHSEDGAMGVIINLPLNIRMGKIFKQLNFGVDSQLANQPVLAGGPVSTERGFVLHPNEGHWESSLEVTPEVILTTSKDILHAMALGSAPNRAQFALGYACWSAGQLEAELNQDSWLIIPADTELLFDIPVTQRWNAAATRLGVDLNLISPVSGHA